MTQKRGFTLVELAIVMTIIGLLIGGILKGQELLENARVTSTIAQIKSYDAAVTAFRDIYGGLPGDLPDAGKRIPGCNDVCTPFADMAGDGMVGQGYFSGVARALISPPDAQQELDLFWMHLLKANLITGVSSRPLEVVGTLPEIGVTNPAAKTGGFFVVTGGGDRPAGTPDTGQVFNGLYVAVHNTLDFATDEGFGPGLQALTPGRAEQIDRKMDDGVPVAGSVLAWGAVSCFTPSGSSYIYLSSVTSKDCGIFARIQG